MKVDDAAIRGLLKSNKAQEEAGNIARAMV